MTEKAKQGELIDEPTTVTETKRVGDVQLTRTESSEPSALQLIGRALDMLPAAGENAPAMVDALDKLMTMKERAEDRDAKRAFHAAMAAFQRDCPPIRKNQTNVTKTQGGATVRIPYADFAEIKRTVDPILGPLGLSYYFDSIPGEGGTTIKGTLMHADGYSIEASAFARTDTRNTLASDPQRDGITDMYAKRRVFSNLLGISTVKDTDGAVPEDESKVSGEQATAIHKIIRDISATETEVRRFLDWIGGDAYKPASYAAIRASDYARAVKFLESKRSQGGA